MGLESEDAVGDVDAGFLHATGPLDVGRLVEAGLQLDDDRDLLALAGRLDQVVDDVGVRRGPVERHLDRVDLGILRRFANEPDHRGGERFVGVMEQDRPVLADDVEDVVPVLQHDVGDRLMRRIMQVGNGELGQLHQITHAHHHVGAVDVVVPVEAELGGEHAAVIGIDAGFDLQPDDRSELAVAEFRLDHRHQIVGLLLVPLGVGVAGDPEHLRGRDLHAREEVLETMGHHILEQNEPVLGPDPQEPRPARADRDLDAGHRHFGFLGKPQGDEKIDRQVGEERKRMRGIHRQRCDEGKDVFEVVVADCPSFVLGKSGERLDDDAALAKVAQKIEIDPALGPLERGDHRAAILQLPTGGPAVDRQLLNPRPDLLLEAADPLHEELVHVGIGDCQELGPLQQRAAVVAGLVEHPEIELEPRQLAAEVEVRRTKIDRRGRPARNDRRCGRAVALRRRCGGLRRRPDAGR